MFRIGWSDLARGSRNFALAASLIGKKSRISGPASEDMLFRLKASVHFISCGNEYSLERVHVSAGNYLKPDRFSFLLLTSMVFERRAWGCDKLFREGDYIGEVTLLSTCTETSLWSEADLIAVPYASAPLDDWSFMVRGLSRQVLGAGPFGELHFPGEQLCNYVWSSDPRRFKNDIIAAIAKAKGIAGERANLRQELIRQKMGTLLRTTVFRRILGIF